MMNQNKHNEDLHSATQDAVVRNEPQPQYQVWALDNFDQFALPLKDEAFDDFEQAMVRCKRITEQSLISLHKAGMSGANLWQHFVRFGESAFVSGPHGEKFSGWDYAQQMTLNWYLRDEGDV